MSQYTSISIDGVISKILRDTRMQDMSYLSDFYEWIPEALSLLNTQSELIPDWKQIHINFHMGKLPCGLIYIDAVEYQGRRLRYYTGIRRLGAPQTVVTSNNGDNDQPFLSKIISAPMPSGPVADSTLVPPTEWHGREAFQLHMGYISTTFSDGDVILHYRRAAVDDRGLPLVPDHPDLKEAIYWFVRMKMIQSGYDDPMYHSDDRMAYSRWEQHAGRAKSDIFYPTPDEKEAQLAMQVRFVPPTDYYESFFDARSGEGLLGLYQG